MSSPSQQVLGQNAHVTVITAGARDSLSSLANQYLGDPELAWLIEQENGKSTINQGDVLVIPTKSDNAIGLAAGGLQMVPILAYHHFGHRDHPLTVEPEQFRAQLTYLRDHGYRVIPLHWLIGFLEGKRQLPLKSAVITLDDGYSSTYTIAFPMLKAFGYPATLFVYTDYIGMGGVSWSQIREMHDSGVISIQPHTKTHANLNRLAAKDLASQLKQIREEVVWPKTQLSHHIDAPVLSFAYPFGETNGAVTAALKSHGYRLGLTVDRGANPFYADPFRLRRTMIYRTDDLATFARVLRTRQPLTGRAPH